MSVITSSNKKISDDAEDVERILTVVVKRRKTVPLKCLEFCKHIGTNEMIYLEKSIVPPEKSNISEVIKQINQEIKRLKYMDFTVDDLNQAEKRLHKFYKNVKDMNIYLLKKAQNA